jgi:NAD(P)-dependent dehydrogenase (short-subunit alcohol dehydrogenase family)
MKLAGKCAIVTGAGAGIGRVYAEALAGEGAAIVIADIDEAAGRKAAAEIADAGGRAIATATDVADEDQVRTMVDAAIEAFGGVDILVNNAGLHLMEYAAPCTQLERSKWRRLLDVNLTGPLLCAAACRPVMKERGGGAIVNQSSSAAYSSGGAYGVSKMALNALTVALAAELAADNIRVNGIAPGLVDSAAAIGTLPDAVKDRVLDSQHIKRLGRMTDLAGALIFLCSDDSAFMTGQTLSIDGGVTRRF